MAAQTIFVRPLPDSATNERLEEIFSEIGPVKQCFVVREKGADKCRGFGYVTYSMEEDAQRALKEIKDYDGKKLHLTVAKKKLKDKQKAVKETAPPADRNEQKINGMRKQLLKSRLIIRNLSFKCTEEDLKETFGKFGSVLEAKIPLKPDGKMRGFAFVLFKTVSGAAKALKTMNLKEIKGRQVAVDWAVPKDKFLASQQSSSSGNKNKEEAVTKTESDTEDEEEEKKQAVAGKKKFGSKSSVQQVGEEPSSCDEDSSEEDEVNDEDDEEENDSCSPGSNSDEEEENDSSCPDSNSDEDESHDEQEDEDDQLAQKKTKKKILPSDVKEGRTVFIRNLSFETDEEGLEEVLLQYGELNYVKVVLHPDTEQSKGCAFAQFKTKEAADKCMEAAQNEAENGGIRVDGRKLFVVAAVSREDAVKLKVEKKKVETGSRNLYLAREGLIRPGTKSAEGVSEADMEKRARFEEIKRAKLRDIGVFVSKTRLCVHNLPKSVDNKKLKALCFQAVKGIKGVRITECRIMYDRKPEKGQVMGQSLGYGFVQFQSHEHALSTLRFLNNNPDIFGSHKRPIVEFSLEDTRKLKLKEMRHQKNKDFAQNQMLKGGMKPNFHKSADGRGQVMGGNKGQFFSERRGKEQGISVKKKPDQRFSGFQTKPEVEHVDLKNGKKRKSVLPFPSHRGPKIRMRDKGKQQVPPPKKAKLGSKRNEHQRRQIAKPMQPKNKVKTSKKHFQSRGGDHFDSLVEQYKKKLMDSGSKTATIKRSKWFNS